MRKIELKKLTITELNERLLEVNSKLCTLSITPKEKIEKPSQKRLLRRERARILTLINQAK